MDGMVQYVSKDRPADRDENDIVSWTLRIDYADIEVYNEYADEIQDSIITKFGALGAMNFEFPPMRSTEPIAQEVELDARIGVADELEAIKLGDGIETSLWYAGG